MKMWRKLSKFATISYGTQNKGGILIRRTYSTENEAVGFIGLGNMGALMAKNLTSKGHSLVVYDIQSASTVPFEKLGVHVASSPAEVAAKAMKVITMLPAGPHVRSCYTGSDGLLTGARAGTVFMDSSTIDADTAKDMANICKTKNCTYFDSPVSGGVAAAGAGTLTFMVGGPRNEYQNIQPLLLKMGSKVVHCGETGAGQAAKVCNNMLLAICMIGTAEAMNLGIKMGLDPKLLASIINSSSGRCWSSEMYNPVPGVNEKVPASRNYEGGFGTSLMCKDLKLAQSAAAGTGTSTPLGGLAYHIYQMMCSQGFSSKDFSSVYQFILDKKNHSTD